MSKNLSKEEISYIYSAFQHYTATYITRRLNELRKNQSQIPLKVSKIKEFIENIDEDDIKYIKNPIFRKNKKVYKTKENIIPSPYNDDFDIDYLNLLDNPI